jgi:Lrp/AsnC family transcriptional regulator, regulator for asnA, asnC and gidA
VQNRPKIDEIDAKILKILLEESRTSFTDIAKNCGISVGAVRMRYKDLWKKGVINGEIMQVNPFSLKYKHVSLIGIVSSKENEDTVLEFLKRKPFVGSVFKDFGKYSFAAPVALPTIDGISAILRNFEANPSIKNAQALIFADDVIVEHPENLVIKPFNGTIPHESFRPKKKEFKMDEIDRKIVKTLSEKSRTPFRKIAERLGISTKNVIERYKKLRGNVLTLSTITVDLTKLGYNAGASLFIKLATKSKMTEVVNELLQIPNVLTVVKYIGDHDLFTYVVFEDFQAYFKMVSAIKNISNIGCFEMHIVPNPPSWPPNMYVDFVDA